MSASIKRDDLLYELQEAADTKKKKPISDKQIYAMANFKFRGLLAACQHGVVSQDYGIEGC